MRYENSSDSASVQNDARSPDARDDTDALAAGDKGPATGNTISGAGTVTGTAGVDTGSNMHIVAIEGAGGIDQSLNAGQLRVSGEHGSLMINAQGHYSYTPKPGTPENVRDVFTYTLADGQGASDTARLTIEIGKTQAIAANAQRIVAGPDGVVTLPDGVQLSDITVVGRDLVILMPDGSQMVIVDGAVFVPQLVLGGVEVPSSNLAALLIDSEPRPASGVPQSGGGNFEQPVGPLDPGLALGDLIPPTELNYTPPEFHDVGQLVDRDPEVGLNPAVLLDDDTFPGGNPGGTGDDPNGANLTGVLSGSGGDGQLTFDLLTTGAPAGFTYVDGPNGAILVQQGAVTVLTVTINAQTGAYTVTHNAPIVHAAGDAENNAIFNFGYTVTDQDGDAVTGALTVNVDDDTPVVDVIAGPDSAILLQTQDGDTLGAASDMATTSANFAGAFTFTGSAGGDGGTVSPLVYALSTAGGASGLLAHGAAINLYLVNGVVIGSTAGTAAGITAENSIFSVSVGANVWSR